MNYNDIIEDVIEIAQKAGEVILEVYNSNDFETQLKSDNSPLTIADQKANDVIINALKAKYPNVPFITEEEKAMDYSQRKNWEYLWLVDPLDGTKEFIKRNGEFTVNIALVKNGKVELGVVYIPVQNKTYHAHKGSGSFVIDAKGKHRINVKARTQDLLKLVGSRSHPSDDFIEYIEKQKKDYTQVEVLPYGSSLKICMVAEGKADVYPRLGPTMEWDTGAAHIIAEEAGATVTIAGSDEPLNYNKENLLNPYFIVSN